MSRELVVASANPGKLREIATLLAGIALRVRPLSDFPSVVLPPEGGSYETNAEAKARAAAGATGRWAVGDDSGLEVDALGGAPGPLSARFGGPGLTDAERCDALLARLAGVPQPRRGARFVCVVAFATPDGDTERFRGECPGRILDTPRGEGGFGYDPIFELPDLGRAMAELSEAEKNRRSHRGIAFAALRTSLARRLVAEAQSSKARARSST